MIYFLHVRKVQQKHGCGTTEVSLIFPYQAESLCTCLVCTAVPP